MKKLLTPSLLVATLLLLVAGGVYAGEEYLLYSAESQHDAIDQKIVEAKTAVVKAARIKSVAGSLDENEALVASHFLKKDDIVDYLGTLQAGGKALGTDVTVVFVTDAGGGAFPRVALSLTLTGSFDSVMRVIGSMENSKYDVVLSSLTLDSSIPEKAKTRVWNASTVLSIGLVPVATSTPRKP